MKKNKRIYILGTLFFLFALVKYVFTAEAVSPVFLSFEVISFMLVLYLVYYTLNNIQSCIGKSNQTHNERDCAVSKKELQRLKNRLLEYETASSKQSGLDSNAFVTRLKNAVVNSKDETSVGILKVLKGQFELMAGIIYHSNSDKEFEVYNTFGVDTEEVNVANIQDGDGVHAQAIADNKAIGIDDIPEDCFEVGSGTGSTKPKHLYILPLLYGNNEGVVFEIASFKSLDIIDVWNMLIKEIDTRE